MCEVSVFGTVLERIVATDPYCLNEFKKFSQRQLNFHN